MEFNSCGDIYNAIDQKLESLEYHKTIPAFIYGIKCDLIEPEVRALQAIVAGMSDEEFEEFNKNVQVWSGPKFEHQMTFRKDGIFSDDFEPGFYDVCSKLAFELF